MPFDGIDPFARRPLRRRPAGSETLLLVLITALSVALLLLPVSMTGLVDLARFVQAR